MEQKFQFFDDDYVNEFKAQDELDSNNDQEDEFETSDDLENSSMNESGEERVLKVRLDKWLWAARFFKTRALARAAVEAGKVFYNSERSKPSREIEIGATLYIRQGRFEKTIIVKGLSTRRRSTEEALQLFEETEGSKNAREAQDYLEIPIANYQPPRYPSNPGYYQSQDQRDRRPSRFLRRSFGRQQMSDIPGAQMGNERGFESSHYDQPPYNQPGFEQDSDSDFEQQNVNPNFEHHNTSRYEPDSQGYPQAYDHRNEQRGGQRFERTHRSPKQYNQRYDARYDSPYGQSQGQVRTHADRHHSPYGQAPRHHDRQHDARHDPRYRERYDQPPRHSRQGQHPYGQRNDHHGQSHYGQSQFGHSGNRYEPSQYNPSSYGNRYEQNQYGQSHYGHSGNRYDEEYERQRYEGLQASRYEQEFEQEEQGFGQNKATSSNTTRASKREADLEKSETSE